MIPKTRTNRSGAFAASLIGLLLFCAGAAWGEEAGRITHLAGTLSALRSDGQKKLLGVNSAVAQGDLLSTEKDSYARIKFGDGSEVVMRPESQLRIDAFKFDATQPEKGNQFLSMLRGGLRAVTGLIGKRNPGNVSVSTPTATIGIRGTHFGALLCQNDCGGIGTASGRPPENGLYVDVSAGAIVLSNPAGQTVISNGQFGFVASVTTPPRVVPPDTGIRILIPPAIARNDNAGHAQGSPRDPECIAQ